MMVSPYPCIKPREQCKPLTNPIQSHSYAGSDSDIGQLDTVVVHRWFGPNSTKLVQTLHDQLTSTNSLEVAIKNTRLDSELSNQFQAKLDALGWVDQACNGLLDLVEFCMAKAPITSQVTQSTAAATRQALAQEIIADQKDCPEDMREGDWSHLRKQLFTAESTSVIIGLVRSEQIPVRPTECKEHVLSVLEQALETFNFNIGEHSIRKLLPTNDEGRIFAAAGVPPKHHSAVAKYLCILQRLQRLVNEPADTGALIRCGYTSADSIASNGVKRAKPKILRRGVPLDRADQICNLAVMVASRNQHMCTRALTLRGAGRDRGMAMVTQQSAGSYSTASGQEDINFDTMFGLDSVSCTDCMSLTGPAAFYVDLLHTLDGMDITTNESSDLSLDEPESLLDKLLERRPDLGKLELSCSNSDVLIPYVDLVNEALESVVWRLNRGIDPILEPINATDQDTEMTNSMQPQHTNFEVYEKVI